MNDDSSASIRNRLIAGMSGLLGLRVAFSGLAFAGTLLLARLLGPAQFGVYSYALAWVFLLAVPSLLGLDQLLVREIAAGCARRDWGLVRGLLRRANQSVLLVSCSAGAVAALAAGFLLRHVTTGIRPTFLIALLFLPLITVTRVRQAAMQGLHKAALGAMPEQLIQPGLLLLFLLSANAIDLRLQASGAMLANVFAAVAACGLGMYLLHRSLPGAIRAALPAYRDREWRRSCLPLMFVAGAAVVFAQADTLILGAFRGTDAVGLYSVAHKGADMIGVILTTQIGAFSSTAASLYAMGERERLQRIVTRLARWTLAASAPATLAMIFFGRWYLLLYGPGFREARTTLAILSIGQLGNVSLGCVGVLVVITGHERRLAVAIGAGALANVALSFVLAPRWGSEGVAVAYSVSMILWNVWAAIELYRLTGLNASPFGATQSRNLFLKTSS